MSAEQADRPTKTKEQNQLSKVDGGAPNPESPDNSPKEASTPVEILEAMEQLPPKARAIFSAVMKSSTFNAPPTHPLFDKFNDEHISKFLDYTKQDDDKWHKYRSSNRVYYLAYACLILAVFIFLVVFLLPSNKDLLASILKIFVTFAGGAGAGFGFKSYLDRDR